MILPTFDIEKEILGKDENSLVFGVDEAGRGPLAGPVVAAAAWVSPLIFDKEFPEKKLVRDSKTLSEKQRTAIYAYMKVSEDFVFTVEEVSSQMIDQMNILQASLLAMRMASEKIKNQISKFKMTNQDAKSSESKSIFLVDGNKKIPKLTDEQRIFTGGDGRIFSIAAASIVAKVHRDKQMKEYHEKFPVYGFNRHKGYGTAYHREQLTKFGACPIHRNSFNLLG
jgi:ribonuclease HII